MTVAIAASSVSGAAAEEVPVLRTERVYFTCLNGDRIQDINEREERFSPWSPVEPSADRSDGGCLSTDLWLETGGLGGPTTSNDVHWKGTFVGNLDRLQFEGYAWFGPTAPPKPPSTLKYTLVVDGVVIRPWQENAVTATVIGPGYYKIVFDVRDLGYVTELDEGMTERAISLRVDLPGSTRAAVDPWLASPCDVWEWGSTDAPGGLTFNPAGM